MALTLYYHPLASFCWKALIALYEAGAPFEPRLVDLADPDSSAEMLSHWPVGKFPVLWDPARGEATPETSIIVEYLDAHYPGAAPLIPRDADAAIQARLWDRFFDLCTRRCNASSRRPFARRRTRTAWTRRAGRSNWPMT